MSYKNKKRKSFNVHLIRFLCSVGGTDKVLMVIIFIVINYIDIIV